MSRPKAQNQGMRVNVWIHPRHVKLYKEIENKTGFVNMALDDAVGVMTMALLRAENPEKFTIKKKVEDYLPEFNEKFPLDPLTAKRLGKTKTCPENSPPTHEAW